MKKIKELWQNKDVRTFIWNVISLFVWTMITLVTDDIIHLNEPWLSIFFLFIVPLTQYVMKYLNKKYFNDIWVTEETKIAELNTKVEKLRKDLEKEKENG